MPVLASDIDGNIGMLGADYDGYFPLGDAAALARLIERAATDAGFSARLRRQCAARAPLFEPAPSERRCALLADLIGARPDNRAIDATHERNHERSHRPADSASPRFRTAAAAAARSRPACCPRS